MRTIDQSADILIMLFTAYRAIDKKRYARHIASDQQFVKCLGPDVFQAEPTLTAFALKLIRLEMCHHAICISVTPFAAMLKDSPSSTVIDEP